MRHIRLCTAVAAALLAQGAFAQSQSSGTVSGTATSTASNQGANSSTNTSGSSAFQNAASNSVSTNSQNNGSASSLNATINILNPTPSSSSTNASTLRSDSTSTTKQTLESNSTSTSRNEQVLSGSQTVYTDYGGSYTVKNVPSMNASPLTSSNDTCMGSASGGVSVAGFGLTAGATYTDEHCKRIKMSRELWNKGMKAASLAMDCMDAAAREALELTGYTCPQTLRAQRAAEDAAQKQAVLSPVRLASRSATYPPALPPEAALAAPPGTPVPEAAAQLALSPLLPEPAVVEPQGNVVVRRVDARGEEAALRARGE